MKQLRLDHRQGEEPYMLENLRTIAAVHEQEYKRMALVLSEERFKKRTSNYGDLSSTPNDSIRVDRSTSTILAYYNLAESVPESTKGQCIVDFGSGRSDLLSSFDKSNQRIAVENNQAHREHQESLGVSVATTEASEIPLPDTSVDKFFATFSKPFWATSPADAATFLEETLRVLRPKGQAHIGPIVTKAVLPGWVASIAAARSLEPDMRIHTPWGDGRNFDESAILASFVDKLVRMTDRELVAPTFHVSNFTHGNISRYMRRAPNIVPTFVSLTKQ